MFYSSLIFVLNSFPNKRSLKAQLLQNFFVIMLFISENYAKIKYLTFIGKRSLFSKGFFYRVVKSQVCVVKSQVSPNNKISELSNENVFVK